jgi:hypothetical protein
MMMIKKILFLLFFSLVLWTGCRRQTTEPVPPPPPSQGSLQGTVKSGAQIVHPSYIFWEDSLIAEPDQDGAYRIDSLAAGTIQLTCSALFFADTTVQVIIQEGDTATLDFNLRPDTTTGFLLGEFQDDSLFQQRLLEDPSLAEWSAQQICDAATGATIQYKTLRPFVPNSFVFLGDSLLVMADAWGQFGIRIQCGTYPFTGICNDYQSVTGVARIVPDGRTYLNFFLPRDN